MGNTHFLDLIEQLREKEEILLHQNVLKIDEDEASYVLEYLRIAYKKEALNYPFEAPTFYGEAALWAAKTVYIASQLILYRENKKADLENLLPDFIGECTPSSILSIDLCLRFLPSMVTQLKLMDVEDELVPALEEKMKKWHYSALNYIIEIDDLNFDPVFKSDCLQQLYLNRIIENKHLKLAKHPLFEELILANMGMFTTEFWQALK